MEAISDNSTSLKDKLLQNGNEMMITELQGAESQGYICIWLAIKVGLNAVHEGAFYQLLVRLSSATSFKSISGNIDVPLG